MSHAKNHDLQTLLLAARATLVFKDKGNNIEINFTLC